VVTVDRSDHDQQTREIEAAALAALRSQARLGPNFHPEELRLEPDGVLLLRGLVEDVAAKKTALEAVARLDGIRGIADHLHVMPAARMADDELRVHVRNGLITDPSLEGLEIYDIDDGAVRLMRGAPLGVRGRIEVEVKKGLVILNGSVPGLTTKRLAGIIAWWVPGTRDVINGLAVEPPEDDNPNQIAEAVRVALEKDPFVNADQIRIGVSNTLVRLTGVVPKESERAAAERDAWLIFGVDRVINEITVRA
jgi:osmotically-inducible protein OsmY